MTAEMQLQPEHERALAFITNLMEGRDLFTFIHENRTAELAVCISRRLELDQATVLMIARGAVIHDVGKMLVPMDLLTKPGKLTANEFELIKMHSQSGYQLIIPLELPQILLDIVLLHHERIDGAGYPQGRKNGEIPLHSRIVSAADATEAIMADRPYRRSFGVQKTLEFLAENREKAFDGQAVDVLRDIVRDGEVEWLRA